MELENEKIRQLFEYRKLPYLYEQVANEIRIQITELLFELQEAIYNLDTYLECNWVLEQTQLNKLWTFIYSVMAKLGYKNEIAIKMCSHIRRYQLHETQLRQAKLPTRLSIEYFYYYKSCDVRLIREILLDKSEQHAAKNHLSDWRYFDLVCEVNDDIEDIFEDMETINANAFLISLKENSVHETRIAYLEFLENLKNKSESRTNIISRDIYQYIHEWTLEYIEKTKHVMDENINKFQVNFINTPCKLEQYLGSLNKVR